MWLCIDLADCVFLSILLFYLMLRSPTSGGCGWGEVVNGGFGLVLDGTDDAERRARSMLFWDVNNGVSRRAWGGNDNANFAIQRYAREGAGCCCSV